MSDFTIGITLDISDNTSDSDADWGLASGIFYWITGRPSYAGSGYSGDAPASKTWKEGIITDLMQVQPAIRLIDIVNGGDYGTLSGFSFELDNTSKFWEFLDTNTYYTINRKVNVYVFLGDVSYQVWSGIVSRPDISDLTYKIVCEDDFKVVHKNIPPEKATRTSYPDIDESIVGIPIPISLGNVKRSKLFPLLKKMEPILLGTYNNNELYTTPVIDIDIQDGAGVKYKILLAWAIEADYLIVQTENYLKVIKGNEQSIRIVGNDAAVYDGVTGLYSMWITLEYEIEGFSASNEYTFGTVVSDNAWFFQIISGGVNHIMSSKTIYEVITSEAKVGLFSYDEDQDEYKNVNDLVNSYAVAPTAIYRNPMLFSNPSNLSVDGDFKRTVAIIPSEVKYMDAYTSPITVGLFQNDFLTDLTGSTALLTDKSRATMARLTSNAYVDSMTLNLNIKFPSSEVIEEMDELYLCCDTFANPDNNFTLAMTCNGVSAYGDFFSTEGYSFSADYIDDLDGTYFDFLPDYYYNPDGDLDSRTTLFYTVKTIGGDTQSYKKYFKISSDLIDSYDDGLSVGYLRLNITLSAASPSIFDFQIGQVGFIGVKKGNIRDDKLYLKIKGETVSGNQTDRVKTSVEQMLEVYDGISSANIDYGNLETSLANTLVIGRQLRTQRSSTDYLKELAQQTFIGIFPTRDGKRGFSYWRGNDTPTVTHDESSIVANSIKKFNKSPLSKVYNDFTINYDEDPARKKFDKSVFISNVDQASFPTQFASTGTDVSSAPSASMNNVDIFDNGDIFAAEITFDDAPSTWFTTGGTCSLNGDDGVIFFFGTVTTVKDSVKKITVDFINQTGLDATSTTTGGTIYANGSSVPEWTTYAGGIADYATGSAWWTICNGSYDRNRKVSKLPNNLQNCHWLPDNVEFDEGPVNAAMTLLQNHVEWNTIQKEIIDYSVPINSTNMALELLNPITFSDAIFTNDVARKGWIQKIKYDFSKKNIGIQLILEPADIVTDDLIIETGDAPDTYTESGSASDTITEGA